MSTVPEKMCYSSALERRALCPGSAAVEAKYPYDSTRSPAAEEGEMLHECTVNMLKTGEFGHELTEDQERDVMYCVNEIAPYMEDKAYTMITEHQLDLTEQDRLNKPRIDIGFINPGEKIIIFELKFGFGYVKHPLWNWQTKDYACGSWITFGAKEVETVILQPRTQEEYWRRGCTFDEEKLKKLDLELREVVKSACTPGAPLVPGQDQCKYCRAKEECPARKGVIETIPKHMTAKAALDALEPMDRYTLLEKVLAAQAWLKDYKQAIDDYLLDGGDIPGWELGEARTRSKWRDDMETITALRNAAIDKDIDPDKLVEPKKPVGLTAAKKVLGNSAPMKAVYEQLVVTPVGEIKPVRVKGFKP